MNLCISMTYKAIEVNGHPCVLQGKKRKIHGCGFGVSFVVAGAEGNLHGLIG